jgi:hypothetical protein
MVSVSHTTDYSYFLAPPGRFIYTHYPRERRWQLLDSPIDRAAHEELPALRPAFFAQGFTPEDGIKFAVTADSSYTLRLKSPKGIAVTAELRQNGLKVEGASVFAQQSAAGPEVRMAFPAAGRYVARFFARSTTLKMEPYQWIMDMRIEARSAEVEGFRFPERFAMFEESGSYLSEPLNGVLEAGRPQLFKISVPGAFEVAIKTGGQFFTLTKQEDSFSGSVPLTPGEVRIAARFPHQPNLRHTLLSYTAE